MEEKAKTKRFSLQGFDARHYRTTQQYADTVEALYNRATADIAMLASRSDVNPDKPFSLDDYPQLKKQIQLIVSNLASQMKSVIETGSRKQWLFACKKNDEFIASIMDTSKLSKKRLAKMQNRNLDALKTFQGRKVNDMDLSARVWKYTEQYKDQIELGLDVGLGDGRSAQQLSRDLRQNLKDSNRLYRRVRDKHGNLQLSKAAKAFHPGIGVYRSSAKNAMRLTRSEINMSYREADWLRWQQLDFVVGFEVKISNRHEEWLRKVWDKSNKGKVEICDQLAGKYPKTFKFKGWHPQCMCYCIPILMNEETFDEQELSGLKAALKGTEYKKLEAKNAVTDMPKGFKDWVANNSEKQANWKSTPYFISDNFKNGKLTSGLKNIYQTSALQAQQVNTEQQNADMQENLHEVIKIMDDRNVEYRAVRELSTSLTDTEIVERISGGDMTSGSCSSLAFAYAGNKCGFDVLDFRDGVSRLNFSRSVIINDIAKRVGGSIAQDTSDFVKAKKLLDQVKNGKEYYFTCGKHAAIVRGKTTGGYEYLELQSSRSNGFKELSRSILKNRFGAQKTHRSYGQLYDTKDCIIDIDLLKKDTTFRKLIGYINTQADKQRKGNKGTVK